MKQPTPPKKPLKPCGSCGAQNEASNTRCRNCQLPLAKKLSPAQRAEAKRVADAAYIARLVAEAPLPTTEQGLRLIGHLTWGDAPARKSA
ncbi:hypothetical protein [Actinocorallia longicatena]|uniref:Zinc ribbon domain-containing protein n=1 Tax=Actinocorallia longicatena TaxID=111803 RepID=A0ABP6QHE0_9ACTN